MEKLPATYDRDQVFSGATFIDIGDGQAVHLRAFNGAPLNISPINLKSVIESIKGRPLLQVSPDIEPEGQASPLTKLGVTRINRAEIARRLEEEFRVDNLTAQVMAGDLFDNERVALTEVWVDRQGVYAGILTPPNPLGSPTQTVKYALRVAQKTEG